MSNSVRATVYVALLISILGSIWNNRAIASDTLLSPDIETVSTGPNIWDVDNGSRYRLVVYLREVYLELYLQKIVFGEEGCCTKIVKTVEVSSSRLGIKGNIYKVSEIKWLSGSSVQFKLNSKSKTIENVEKLMGRNPLEPE